jgi:hypothetical protein
MTTQPSMRDRIVQINVPLSNKELIADSDSPTYLLRMSLGPTEIRAASASPAIALASCVYVFKKVAHRW